MWEDEKNKRGGRWLITLNKQQRRSDLDRFWLETVRFSNAKAVLEYRGLLCSIMFFFPVDYLKREKMRLPTLENLSRRVTSSGRVNPVIFSHARSVRSLPHSESAWGDWPLWAHDTTSLSRHFINLEIREPRFVCWKIDNPPRELLCGTELFVFGSMKQWSRSLM